MSAICPAARCRPQAETCECGGKKQEAAPGEHYWIVDVTRSRYTIRVDRLTKVGAVAR